MPWLLGAGYTMLGHFFVGTRCIGKRRVRGDDGIGTASSNSIAFGCLNLPESPSVYAVMQPRMLNTTSQEEKMAILQLRLAYSAHN